MREYGHHKATNIVVAVERLCLAPSYGQRGGFRLGTAPKRPKHKHGSAFGYGNRKFLLFNKSDMG